MTRDEIEAAMSDLARQALAAEATGLRTAAADLRGEWRELKAQYDAAVEAELAPTLPPGER